MFLERVPRYYHTLRYLRPVQVYGRVWHRLRPCAPPSPAPAPPLRQRQDVIPAPRWVSLPTRVPTLLGPTTFRFLNQTRDIAQEEDGWNLRSAPEKLWLLNLHYFDDLNAGGSSGRTDWHYALIERWIRGNPPARGIGWEDAYAVSLRIVNWVKWSLSGSLLSDAAVHSLAVQARHLRANLETYLLGNHVLANAKALIFAGAFFTGTEAERDWLHTGFSLLERELAEEILPDGGHYEHSPMYHSIILEDLLDLCNLVAARPEAVPPRWREFAATWPNIAGKMRQWLKLMCHPDGEISFFNDAALGIAPTPAELEKYAARLGLPPCPDASDGLTLLPESGYVRWQRGEVVALLDVGTIGPDHIPGHSHADTLSFELSLYGRRVLVNSGTSAYKIEPARSRERGTAAHNTVVVDGEDSSEVWGTFRVARRARPLDLCVRENADKQEAEVICGHSGYQRLPGQVIHLRKWRLREREIEISDVLTGKPRQAEARFHISPNFRVAASQPVGSGSDSGAAAITPVEEDETGIYASLATVGGTALRVEPSAFHPRFGESEPNQCLVAPFAPGEADTLLPVRTTLRW